MRSNNFQTREPWRLLIAIGILFVVLNSCNNTDNPLTTGIGETNLFPFAQGRVFVYSDYNLDTTTTQKIQSTVHREAWYVQGTTTLVGKTAFRIIDSVYFPNGTFSKNDTLYFTVESGDLSVMTRDFNNTWIKVFQSSAGTNAEYTAGQFTSLDFGALVTVKVTIFPKEAVTATIGTVQAYKVQMKQTATVSGVNVEQVIILYIADGYGLVKLTQPVQVDALSKKKEFGEEFIMVSKNFQ